MDDDCYDANTGGQWGVGGVKNSKTSVSLGASASRLRGACNRRVCKFVFMVADSRSASSDALYPTHALSPGLFAHMDYRVALCSYAHIRPCSWDSLSSIPDQQKPMLVLVFTNKLTMFVRDIWVHIPL